jgi:hypothetical protein
MADSKEKPQTDKSETPKENSLTSVSGSLAAIFIRKNIESGGKTKIPSLKIEIEKKQSS